MKTPHITAAIVAATISLTVITTGYVVEQYHGPSAREMAEYHKEVSTLVKAGVPEWIAVGTPVRTKGYYQAVRQIETAIAVASAK